MNIETFLAIASFSISAAGFFSAVFYEGARKISVLVMIIAVLVPLTGISLYGQHRHNSLIKDTQIEILGILRHDGQQTFDDIYPKTVFRNFATVNEALFTAVADRVIEHQVIEVNKDGKVYRVRLYFLTSR